MESKRYFESRFFKRLFFSYVLLIGVFMLVYTVWYVVSYQARWEQDAEKTAQQRVTAYPCSIIAFSWNSSASAARPPT